jgi:hypothetical protein
MPIILATQEGEMRRFGASLGKLVHETLSQNKKKSQNRAGGMVQGISPEFKSQY